MLFATERLHTSGVLPVYHGDLTTVIPVILEGWSIALSVLQSRP